MRRSGNKNTGPAHNRFKHGFTKSPTYRRWAGMLYRCNKTSGPDHKNYAARGITVCERWHDFINFLEDMGECPPGLTLDRIDNDRGYELGNCRWADRTVQNMNRRFVIDAQKKVVAIREARANGWPLKKIADAFGISVSRASELTSKGCASLRAAA